MNYHDHHQTIIPRFAILLACIFLNWNGGIFSPVMPVLPQEIDPWVQQGKLTASDGQAENIFGSAIAVSGNTIVVGAAGVEDESGAAYVFTRPDDGWTTMNETAKLTPSDSASLDWFGYSVAMDGDIIVVGAPGGPTSYSQTTGSTYIFVKPEEGWVDMTETAKLTASDGGIDDRFGLSVGMNGDTVVVGALRHDTDGVKDQGAAYIFVKPDGGWANMTQTAKLTAEDGLAYDGFGISVATSQNTIIIGAISAYDNQGAAYVFTKPLEGWENMTQIAKLVASDAAQDDTFGSCVAISNDDTVVVGSYSDAIGSNQQQGSAYVFVKPVEGWVDTTENAKLTASDGAEFDFFGWSVAISGDSIVIGSVFDSIDPNDLQGSVYVFTKPTLGWSDMTETIKLIASDGSADDSLGWSVAIDGATLVAGAYTASIGANSYQGAAYVFSASLQARIFLPLIMK